MRQVRMICRVVAALALLGTSCGQLDALKRENAALRSRLDAVELRERERDDRVTKNEGEFRRVWSRVACNSESVKDFLKTCEQEGSTCGQLEVAVAFKDFLDTQEYVRLYLRPDIPFTEGMVKLRQTQLEDQADASELHSGTRFIVVILPRSQTAAHEEEAMNMGRQIIKYLRKTLHIPSTHSILGPKTLPCNYKRQELLKQRRRIDARQSLEPHEAEPTLHVWVFKTECH